MKKIDVVDINGRRIGPDEPVYIVAEMSANHNQNFENALNIISAAKKIGADAIKLQTYSPETITIDSHNKYFQIGSGTIWEGCNLYSLYKEAYMPWEWQPKLKEKADEIGITIFSSPFDHSAVDFLEDMDVPAYKIASFEIVDIPLIRKIAQTGKPIIMSTGMATLAEIDEAVSAIQKEGNDQIVLLKCTSAYPAPPEEMNLNTIPHLAKTFGLPVGLSDHTTGIAVPVTSVALGISFIEKHFTLSRDIPGPDSTFSLEPHEFSTMIESIRVAEKALGQINYKATENEKNLSTYRRSLFIVNDMEKGEIFNKLNIKSIRPGNGLPPKYLNFVLGRKAAKDLKKGTPLEWNLIS